MRVMPPPPQHSRIDLAELKSQISKRIGMERSRSYFAHLNRFLGRKLTKHEFDKLCLATLGRENVPLHNRLVNAILRNACHAKTPPPPLPLAKDGKRPPPSLANAGSHMSSPSTSSSPPLLPNGDMLPQSPRRVRSAFLNRRIKDRPSPSPLGPNLRADVSTHPSHAQGDHSRENGESVHCDLRRPVQVSIAENSSAAKWKQQQQQQQQQRPLISDVASLQVKDSADVEVELVEDVNSMRAGVQAPLGLPFCPVSVGGARSPQNFTPDVGINSCSYGGQLCHAHALKERMDQIAESQGLGGVTLDCANVLNVGLDNYLKQLIRSCVDIVGERYVNRQITQHESKQRPQGKIINGMWLGNHVNSQGGSGIVEDPQHPGRDRSISLLDFRVAMELNVQQLGEDWPLLLEKICLHSYEE